MFNQVGQTTLRRCLYCGRQFMPINGSASFCCYGHYAMYVKGDVFIPEEAITQTHPQNDDPPCPPAQTAAV